MERLSFSDRSSLVKLKLVSLAFVNDYGFSLFREDHALSTELMGEVYEYWFSNNKGIEISVDFSPDVSGDDSFTIFIYRREIDANFSLEDWQKTHGSDNSLHEYKLASYQGTYAEKLEGFMDYLELVFTKHNMPQILLGETWEDVEFDWGGMR